MDTNQDTRIVSKLVSGYGRREETRSDGAAAPPTRTRAPKQATGLFLSLRDCPFFPFADGKGENSRPPRRSAALRPLADDSNARGREFASLFGGNKKTRPMACFFIVVGERRLELPASWSRTKRATSCATPRQPFYYMNFGAGCQGKKSPRRKKGQNLLRGTRGRPALYAVSAGGFSPPGRIAAPYR